MLEVIESDFTKGLAELIATEEASAAEYEKTTKENEISKTTKEQDVKYKTKNAKELDASVAELSSDMEGAQAELDAVLDYFEKLKEQCIEKAETAGLKEALGILEGTAVLLQNAKGSQHTLRG